MSTQMKLIIPLLDDKITKEDISKNAGFVGAYTRDINRPYLDNHIFLLYDSCVHNKYTENREIKFSDSKYLYGKRYLMINKKYYTLYTFSIVNPDIKRFLQGLRHLNHNSFIKIFNFWKNSDLTILNYLCKTLDSYTCTGESVPEEDYLITSEEFEEMKKEPEGLEIDLSSSFCFIY